MNTRVLLDRFNDTSSIQSSSYMDRTSEREEKKNNWKLIKGLVEEENYEEALTLALNSDDEMLLIRLISKTGSK